MCLCMWRFADSLLKAVPQVLALQEQLKKAVQDGDMETSHGICRIAVALGETHCRLDIMIYMHHQSPINNSLIWPQMAWFYKKTNSSSDCPCLFGESSFPSFCPSQLPRTLLEQVDHWQGFQALVSMIMFCTGTPGHYPVDETSSSLTLTFWYTLQVQVHLEKSLMFDVNWCCVDLTGADMMFWVLVLSYWLLVSGWYNVIGCWEADALSTNLQACVLPAGGCSAAEGLFPQRWGICCVVLRWQRAVQDLQVTQHF